MNLANRLSKQSGMTVIGFLIVVVIVASLATISVKMLPAYADYYMYRDLFDRVAETPNIRSMTNSQIEATIIKRMQTNQLKTLKMDDVFIGDDGGLLVLEFAYKVEKHIGGNVDVVMTFEYTKEIE
ncbi:Uncharacterised protein [BD1-7 clade bacterium]|uniref:DUF4845 domain-containing protein n=1 Tax=BD1-7 clade bacterium TaxID=2029982 RepID=A0A5S9P9D8_9GAMM|nr:Uncharacterised protein [BD1-7 clade bacterium]CAA0115959.1 Uncharacterised protein [BD1-7 clade bacterium]